LEENIPTKMFLESRMFQTLPNRLRSKFKFRFLLIYYTLRFTHSKYIYNSILQEYLLIQTSLIEKLFLLSGALDVASRQLDQMIDQARLRHNQHRSRFKEAINFLDNIFEDFQKDCGDLKKPNQNQKLLPLEKSIASNVQNQKQPKMVEPVVQVTVTTATPKNARKEASKNPPPQKTSQQFQTLATEK
jgi:hypothetical protein